MVSIITPTYNCGRFIGETIQSVVNQTYTDWEMIIVDDCSTDETRQVVEQWMRREPRIRYYINEKNLGAACTRNRALREAKGRWVAFLDSDDLWLPEKLEHQLQFMTEHGYSFTYHEYTEINEQSEPLGVKVSGISRVGKFAMFACCWPGCLSVMYDREKIGLIQIADIRKNNDTAMWLKAVRKAPCYLLREDLALYRRRQGSITPVSIWGKIKAHYPLFRIGEGMPAIVAWFWTFMNVGGNAWKKLFYVSKNVRNSSRQSVLTGGQ
ncbi:MAG: glycosyltransferase family 2 protein [Bacteroidales bacterium]|nr:glycosyltransferase family 2 protein [Candidatus Liminaster caballi]